MLTENDRRNVIIAATAILALIVVCMASIGWYKSVVAQQVDRDTINITQDAYGQALAKWRAQHITEYEISLESGASEATLHVSGEGADIKVLKQSVEGSEVSLDNSTGELSALREASVEHLLQMVSDALDNVQLGQDARHTDGKFDYFFDYEVSFDPTRGYPTHYAQYNRTTLPSREITWRGVEEPAINVKELKPLR